MTRNPLHPLASFLRLGNGYYNPRYIVSIEKVITGHNGVPYTYSIVLDIESNELPRAISKEAIKDMDEAIYQLEKDRGF